MTDTEWCVLADFEVILVVRPSLNMRELELMRNQIPHGVQQVMSSESNPILTSAIPCFEMFMTTWEKLAALHPNLAPWIKTGLDWATSYYLWMDHTDAYIVLMCKLLVILNIIIT